MKNLSDLLKIVLFTSCANYSFAQNVQFMWLDQIGNTPGFGVTKASSVVGDMKNQDVYVTGYTNVAMGYRSIQNGKDDYFLTRYDASGSQLWSLQVGAVSSIGTPGITRANSVSIDKNRNVYITGSTNVTISKDGSKQTGLTDYFIAEYTYMGVLLWSTQYGTAQNI